MYVHHCSYYSGYIRIVLESIRLVISPHHSRRRRNEARTIHKRRTTAVHVLWDNRVSASHRHAGTRPCLRAVYRHT